jgi:predicted dehydrogenase
VRMLSIAAGTVLALAAPLAGAADGDTVWFVIGERDVVHGDSYLLPLTNPDDIAQARQLLAQGPGSSIGSIASVRIAKGADGYNRDVRREGEPSWNWHVTEFEGFSDFAIELCDGWPSFIEEDVDAFIANTNNQVCFWSYTVVAELDATPPFAIHDAIDGAWYSPEAPGQGLMIDVLVEAGQIFTGWFTYDYRAGAAPGTPLWITAQGPYSTSRPTRLTVTNTTGGTFNGPTKPVQTAVGTLMLEFDDCNHGTMRYTLDDGPTGEARIERLVPRTDCVVR